MAPALIVQDETYGPMADTLGQGAKLVVPSGGVAMDADGVFTLVGASNGLGPPTTVELDADELALPETSRYVLVRGEGYALDDLTTITGGDVGAILYLQTESDAAPITIKHDVENVVCDGGFDVVLADSSDMAVLVRDQNVWTVVAVRTLARRNVPASEFHAIDVQAAAQDGDDIEVTLQVRDLDGNAVPGECLLWIDAFAQTPGEGTLGPPTTPVGEALAVNNAAAGPNSAIVLTDANGAAAFKVTDAATELVALRINGSGCSTKLTTLSFEVTP